MQTQAAQGNRAAFPFLDEKGPRSAMMIWTKRKATSYGSGARLDGFRAFNPA